LRVATPSPPSGWGEDFHLQAVDHARHTELPTGLRPWHVGSEPEIQLELQLALVDLLLKLDIPLDDGFINADRGREEADRPACVTPGPLRDLGEALAEFPTGIRLDLADDR
jgi:hypothetical protein